MDRMIWHVNLGVCFPLCCGAVDFLMVSLVGDHESQFQRVAPPDCPLKSSELSRYGDSSSVICNETENSSAPL